MKNIFFISICFIILYLTTNGNNLVNNINIPDDNISPKNNAKLNYTQVMFDYPEIKKAIIYKVQIAEVND